MKIEWEQIEWENTVDGAEEVPEKLTQNMTSWNKPSRLLNSIRLISDQKGSWEWS